jgi:hypothetical protein
VCGGGGAVGGAAADDNFDHVVLTLNERFLCDVDALFVLCASFHKLSP